MAHSGINLHQSGALRLKRYLILSSHVRERRERSEIKEAALSALITVTSFLTRLSGEFLADPDRLSPRDQYSCRSGRVSESGLAREERRALAEANAPRGADEASFARGCCVEEEEEGDEERGSIFSSAHRSAMHVIGSGGGSR